MGAYKDKIVKELLKNKQYDLANMIDTIESDVDVANYISSNRGYFTKAYTTPDLELMPEFRKILYSDLKTGEVDLDKEFGSDWYKDYEQIPSDQIKFVADKQGVTYGKLVNEMGKQATEKRRQDIAKDGSLSGYITEFVAPRSVEAIERGESPSISDAFLDIGQNVAYAVPWGRISAPLARLGFAGKLGQGTIGNAATPLIMESADAIAYDDSTRGKWKLGDVITESTVNATTPWLLRGAMMGAGKLTTGKGRDLVNKWMQLGTDRTTKEDVPGLLTELNNNQFRKDVANTIAEKYPNTVSLIRQADAAAYNKESAALRESVINKLDTYQQMPFTGKPNFTQEELKLIATDPEIRKLVDTDILPTNRQLRTEEEIKNYLTNQAGTYWYDEESPWTRVPVVGTRIDKYIKDKDKEEQSQAKRDSILLDVLTKYGSPRGL